LDGRADEALSTIQIIGYGARYQADGNQIIEVVVWNFGQGRTVAKIKA
jgi:hypothetical protein